MRTRDRIIMAAPLLILIGFSGVGLLLLILNILLAAMFIGAAVILFFVFLRTIPAAPPHVVLVTIWGERIPKIKKEGKRLFAKFFPFYYDGIPVNVEKKNKDFLPKDVWSKERAEMLMEISVTWTPDSDIGNPQNLREYINTGGKEGVETILDDIIEENAREFASEKGWEECMKMKKELAAFLIEQLTGRTGPEIIQELRRGNGVEKIPSLGIVLNRFNVGRVRPLGKLAEAAEKIAIEERERDSEIVELRHVKDRAKEIRDELEISGKDALEVVQTERGKVKKEIKEFKGFAEIADAAARGLERVFKK